MSQGPPLGAAAPSEQAAWSTPTRVVAGFLAGGLLALGLGLGLPGPGQLLFGVATLALVTEGLRGLMLRPSVTADRRGVAVVRGIMRVEVPWSRVTRIGVMDEGDSARPPRRRARALEIDTGDNLLLVPAYRLDAPLDEVVSVLRERLAAARSR